MKKRAWFSLIALGLLACGDTPTPPDQAEPGWLNVRFSSPHTDDGGILFSLAGGPIDSVTVTGLEGLAERRANIWRVVAVGDLSSGVVARIFVPDIGRIGDYSATIEQVAARATYVQRDASTYSLKAEMP